ncbi:LLM class flavin-dependent oxidoreductase [Gordonia sp. GN26]
MTVAPPVVWFLEHANAAALSRAVVELDLAGVDAVVLPTEDTATGAADPLLVAASVARRAQHIGLVLTLSPWSQPPFLTARALNTLDAMSHGRAGWFVSPKRPETLSTDDSGRWTVHGSESGEIESALSDYLGATAALWNSWEPNSVIADVESGRYVDADLVHVVDYRGPYYSTRGPLNAPRPPQGRPVTFSDMNSGTVDPVETDVLVVDNEHDVDAGRRSGKRVLLRVRAEDVLSMPPSEADGYAISDVGLGGLFGQVLHEVFPAPSTPPHGQLLRDRLGLDPGDFEFRAGGVRARAEAVAR